MGAGLSAPGAAEQRIPQNHRVQLVATCFGPRIPGIGQAHHTSVVVHGVEYWFNSTGINKNEGIRSHIPYRNTPQIFEYGFTTISGHSMVTALSKDFQKNSYDLLRKNCNSFSECALFYLCGTHLGDKFRILEKIGRKVDNHTGFIKAISGGAYKKNPAANAFKTIQVEGAFAHHDPLALRDRD
uniref:PPPDE domain-containing protein n=1 Tax=Strombidinopsis acuminata TaxID=141414 RepID=A0A7S3T1P5_9SPIT|mmetsp:Transcript_59476/g.153144  ORF Transcript_59476/g.153144 Transcript_59476/m.153144 type:complete len:184 (-) Transcript_59476:171-722(-)